MIGTPGFGAVAVGVLSFVAKCYMSFTVRLKIANMGHAEAKKYFETPERVFVWKTQMNGLRSLDSRLLYASPCVASRL